MKRIPDTSAPTRGRVELVTGPDDRPLLVERFRTGNPTDTVRSIEYMNAQWHLMGASPIPPTGIRVVDDDDEEVMLSRGPISFDLGHGGYGRNGRVVVGTPKCVACLEGRHQPKPTWHTWADDQAMSIGSTREQRCSCECAGPQTVVIRGEE